jgi:knotted carbamoyltransferase YgeW
VGATNLESQLSALDGAALESLYAKSLLLTSDWSLADLYALVSLAEALEALDRARVRLPLLGEELAYAVFFDNSTRTKSAWAGAASRLGMRPVIVDGSSTQVAHGETAEETGAMLGMNAHALGVRHDKILGEGNPFMRAMLRGIEAYLDATGDTRQVPMVNLQCDVDHPTQCMADLIWLKQHFGGKLKGRKVAVTWAYSPSYAKPLSVPQGLITLLPRLGMDVVLAHPEGYDLTPDCVEFAARGAEEGGGSFRRVDSMDEAFAGAEAVYPKSWGPRAQMLEKVAANQAGDDDALADIERRCLEHNARFTDWICDERRMASTKDALYMHCLPADPGAEVAEGVLRSFQVQVARQANKKVYVIMALLAAAKVRDLRDRLLGLV